MQIGGREEKWEGVGKGKGKRAKKGREERWSEEEKGKRRKKGQKRKAMGECDHKLQKETIKTFQSMHTTLLPNLPSFLLFMAILFL